MRLGTLIVAVAAASLVSMTPAASATPPLTTVERVDLSRYVGTWHEIARYPNRFQRDCASNTTARYELRDDGKIQVVNSCRQANGETKTARGKAKVADKLSNAKLRVTFFWPFYGDYWIIGLDPEYRYAIVGEPKRKYLWILSRTPVMDPETYERAVATIREAGYDPAKLIHTKQTQP